MSLPADAWETFRERAASFGAPLDDAQLAAFRRYLDLLCEWNRHFNLTAIREPAQILARHFLDALACARALDWRAARSLIDVGSGAGLPGIPLAIAFPHLEVVLVDSSGKKVAFCERVAAALELPSVRAIHGRAEDLAREPACRERFDVAVARAVARLNVLAEWCLPFVRVGGQFLAMKGPDVLKEVAEARRALEILGGGEPVTQTFTLPGTDAGRGLILIPKERPTPPDYPRRTGAAPKRPL